MTLLEQLRRHPDLEAPNLFAVDATDRLLLDEAAAHLANRPAAVGPQSLVAINDHFGALTLGMLERFGPRPVRVFQDALVAEAALDGNAERAGRSGQFEHHDLDQGLVADAELVLVQAPKSLDALRELTELIARHAAPDATVLLGGRVKHMTPAMNEILAQHFDEVHAGLARQKSRVITARGPRRPSQPESSEFPVRAENRELGLTICAHGGVFAGSKLDLGTRQLLSHLAQSKPDAERAIDLGCGTGVLAAALAKARPTVSVLASDQSRIAVASAAATMAANGLTDQVSVVREASLASVADASIDLILCNPPFHNGTEVNESVALALFAAAGRVLAPGGELWTVYNSHLHYRPALTRAVGLTTQQSRTTKFTVTRSVARPAAKAVTVA
jgi:16S rRNA (guanine1207-N2)-methyltransferase